MAALALAVAACGGEQEAASRTGDAAQEQAADGYGAVAPAPAPAPAAAGTTVSVSTSEELGSYLVDGEGRTLYRFDQDAPGQTNCAADCLAKWPPLVTSGALAPGDGADLTLLGTLARPDGSIQAMYADWPLYYFAEDAAPGDIKGHRVGEVWWAVAPDGSKIGAGAGAAPAAPAAPADAAPPAEGAGAYGDYGSAQASQSGGTASPPQVAEDVTITSAYDPHYGTYLTTGDGLPLYRSNADDCAISNCSGACAESWPAVTLEGVLSAGGEVDQALLETFARTDGATQAMVADWPVYTHSGDQAGTPPTGHGAGDGQWSLINLSGKRKDA